MNNKLISSITAALVIIGAINWGLVGALKFDLVSTIFGKMSFMTKTIYVLVGLSGLFQGIKFLKNKM